MTSKAKASGKPGKSNPPVETNPVELRRSVISRAMRQSLGSGRLTFPAVPALSDHIVGVCGNIFAALGRPFNPEQLEHARKIFAAEIEAAFNASSRSRIVVTYEAKRGNKLDYKVAGSASSIEHEYETWLSREPPLFGKEPDARVMAVAESLGRPEDVRVLDIGAGDGRNALPLARRGHPVDAVEMTVGLAKQLREHAGSESLKLRVIERELMAAASELSTGYQLVFLSEVVSDFRGLPQLRATTELANRILAPGGCLVMNIFLSKPGNTPDRTSRELAQQLYSTIFTPEELKASLDGLDLQVIDDVSVHDYEQEHLPAGAFPQTGWYVEWVRGQDVFDTPNPPIEMRWITCRKS